MSWWDRNKGKPITLSISGDFHDRYLKCLARKVEWGFPDAIFDMEQTHDPQVIPVLRALAKWGNPKRRPFLVTTLQGRAQLALARLGDQEELHNIERELELPGFGSAIEEIRQAGGPVALQMLVNALDSPDYLPQYRGKPGYERLQFERDEAISKALTALVMSPPQATKPADRQRIWEDWWAKNRRTARFVTEPVKTYE